MLTLSVFPPCPLLLLLFNLVEHLEAQSKKKRTTVPLGSEPTLGHKDKMQMIGPKGLPPRSVRFHPSYEMEWSAVECSVVGCCV